MNNKPSITKYQDKADNSGREQITITFNSDEEAFKAYQRFSRTDQPTLFNAQGKVVRRKGYTA